ncbi:hypothetical protein [Nocardia sp. NPDC003963]
MVVDTVPFHIAGNAYCRGIVPHINRLAHALRTTGGTVVWALPGEGGPLPHAIEFFGAARACDRDHNATLHTIYRSFGDVRPTSEVLDMIEASRSNDAHDRVRRPRHRPPG